MSPPAPLDGAAGQPSVKQPSILTNMTTGIELEALIYAPRGIGPVRHLSNALCKPVLLDCSKCNKAHPWRLPFNNLRDQRRYIEEKTWYAGWQITDDMSAQPDKDERPKRLGILSLGGCVQDYQFHQANTLHTRPEISMHRGALRMGCSNRNILVRAEDAGGILGYWVLSCQQ